MNWYKKARFITEDELREKARSLDYSLLQCVECGRWIDMMKKAISDWKFEKEMSEDESKVVNEVKESIANGRGGGFSTCRHCVTKSLKESGVNSTMSVSPSVPMSEDVSVSVSPRQIYTRDDVIQNREDLAPSMLRKKKKKRRRKK